MIKVGRVVRCYWLDVVTRSGESLSFYQWNNRIIMKRFWYHFNFFFLRFLPAKSLIKLCSFADCVVWLETSLKLESRSLTEVRPELGTFSFHPRSVERDFFGFQPSQFEKVSSTLQLFKSTEEEKKFPTARRNLFVCSFVRWLDFKCSKNACAEKERHLKSGEKMLGGIELL